MNDLSKARFDHFIITRFSVVFESGQPPASDEWLRYRMGFFREAPCAALSRQFGHPSFKWLVFFDAQTPEWLRQEISELCAGLFEPIFTSELFGPALVAREITARSDAPFLITTRLDSDDGVANRFVSAIHEQFDSQSLMYIDFPLGYQMDRSGAIYRYSYPSNAFISLIELRTPASPKTVFYNPRHGQARTIGPVREVITTPMWMQIVHGSNIANNIRGRRISPRKVSEHYDFDLAYRIHVPPIILLGEILVQGAKLGGMWVKRPWLAQQWLKAARDRIRGTHTKPRYYGKTAPRRRKLGA